MANPWCTLEQARDLWADAPLDDDTLDLLLDGAYEQCAAYAPVSVDPVPFRFTQAVALQAQDVWNAFQRNTGDVVGFADSGLAVRVRPLSSSVRALLRPRRGVPMVG